MKANTGKIPNSRNIFILKNVSYSLFCPSVGESFLLYFSLSSAVLFTIASTWNTQRNIEFKLKGKWTGFEHGVIACRSAKVLVSIVCIDLAFQSNLASTFFPTLGLWNWVFFCLFSVAVWLFLLSMHCMQIGDKTKKRNESSISSLFVRLTSPDYKE